MTKDMECSPVKRVHFRDIDEVIDYLKEHGRKIGKQFKQGNKEAREVLKWYEFLYKAPGDPGAQAFLMVAVEDYIDKSVKGEYTI